MPGLDPKEIQRLADQYLRGTIGEKDRQRLDDWYEHASDHLEWEDPAISDREGHRAQMLEGIKEKIEGDRAVIRPVHRVHFMRRWRWSVAAAVILLIGAGGFWLLRQTAQPAATAQVVHDVKAPTSNRAIITSSDGKQVEFDGAAQGALLIAGAVKTGSNSLKFEAATAEAVQMRTVSNPKGSKAITMELPDGTLAWLNAASSISFPSRFTGNERVVMMSGEAYFEVKHGAQAFKVKAGRETIEDIGTKFNVRAYGDEVSVRTTLVEGAVKTRDRILKPGEQAVAATNSFKVIPDANVDDVTAWKDNRFKYHSVEVTSILSDAARWYDVEIDYRGRIDGTVTGGIERDVNASEFLKILEATGRMRFEISDKKITVIPIQ